MTPEVDLSCSATVGVTVKAMSMLLVCIASFIASASLNALRVTFWRLPALGYEGFGARLICVPDYIDVIR